MPAFYPRPMANQMPPTPPDSGTGYGYGSVHFCPDPYAQQAVAQSRRDTPYDYQQSYIQPAVAPVPPSYSYAPHAGFQNANSLPPIHNYYEPTGAPILPPLRIQDRVSFADGYQRCLQQQQQQQQEQQSNAAYELQRQASKEEKPTGGVSATLDYDMERMTDFVVWAVQCIFQYNMQNPPSFRKWVHQVLSATRLPSATIVLSLHYLHDRVTNRPGSFSTGENQIYRLLAVSLILGSKFLDDNTFINRSWSDVTAIKVSELNMLEMQWLQLIDYRLHVDPNAPKGLPAWIDSWKEYEAKHSTKPTPARLSPLNTHTQRRERFSPYPSPYSATVSARFSDGAQSSHSSTFNSNTPYTPADTWAQTDRTAFDDFYKRQHRYPTLTEIDDVNRRLSEERSRVQSYASNAHASYYHTPTYTSPWAQHAWHGMNRYDCTGSSCSYQGHYRHFMLGSNHAAQTVMG